MSWTITYQLERRYLRWRVHVNYLLLSPPDGGASHSAYVDMPKRYWFKEHAQAELVVLELLARYGQPKLEPISPERRPTMENLWFINEKGQARIKGWTYKAITLEMQSLKEDNWMIIGVCPRCGAIVPSDSSSKHNSWHANTDYPIPGVIRLAIRNTNP